MTRILSLLAVSTVAILAGCEETNVERPAPATAPEYLNCKSVPEALSQADQVVRSPGSISANEKAFWYDRKGRLEKRAWECKKRGY